MLKQYKHILIDSKVLNNLCPPNSTQAISQSEFAVKDIKSFRQRD